MVPSPKVATYDLKPEMSADEVTKVVLDAIAQGEDDAIVLNYANSDMVGHTGVECAASGPPVSWTPVSGVFSKLWSERAGRR